MGKYIAALVLFLAPGAALVGQEPPAAVGGGSTGVYALFSAGRPNYGSQWLFGGTAGGLVQLNKFLGADGRVMGLRWGPSPNHQYAAVLGPRVAFNRSRWTMFGSAEGGLGHARHPAGISERTGVAYSAGAETAGAWWLTTGVDYQVNSRFAVRVGEFDYGKIYVLESGLDPKIFSVGVVIRPF